MNSVKKDYSHPNHIARTYYDERGRVYGYISDDCVTHDPKETHRIISNVSRIMIDAMVAEAMKKTGATEKGDLS